MTSNTLPHPPGAAVTLLRCYNNFMLESLITIFTNIIQTGGYASITFLMALESMIVPVPSEAVMPFAGFLWFAGKMSFWPIIFFSTLGSIIGSLISYYMGFYGGEIFVRKYGKYFFLNTYHLELTEKFFKRFGGKAVFVSRFIPVVRHLISIPAGAGKMNVYSFILYTSVGAAMWHAILTYVGYSLAENWYILKRYTGILDIIIVIGIMGFILYWFYKKYKTRRSLA